MKIIVFLISILVLSGCVNYDECPNHLVGDSNIGIVKDFETTFIKGWGWDCTITFDDGIKKHFEGQLCRVLETEKMLVDDGYNCEVGYRTYKMVKVEPQTGRER